MATPAGAIYATAQTYGNGMVTFQGGFTDSGSAAIVVHGKGFKVVRGVTGGVYKVTLQSTVKSIHSCQAQVNAPASTADGAFSHPGFAVAGDLQSDGVTFYVYTYNFAGSQGYMGSTTTICEFEANCTTSSLNA